MPKHTVGVQQIAVEQMTNQNRPNVSVYVWPVCPEPVWQEGKPMEGISGWGTIKQRKTNHLEAAPCRRQTRPPSGLSCHRCWWRLSRDTGCSPAPVALGRHAEAVCWAGRSCCPELFGLLPRHHCHPGPQWQGWQRHRPGTPEHNKLSVPF